MKRAFFRMDMGKVKLALLILLLVGALAIAALDIAILAGAFTVRADAVAGVSLGAAALIFAGAALIIFNSGYRFDDACITVKLGVFGDKIKYDDISRLKQETLSGDLYLISGGDFEGTTIKINIQKKDNDAFIAALRERLPNVAVEYFSYPRDDKNQR